MNKLLGIALIIGFYFLGISIKNIFNLTVPASIVGLIALFICLFVNDAFFKFAEKGATPFLNNLALLFIPAGVGLIQYLEIIKLNFLVISALVIVTTLVNLWLSAFSFKFIFRGEND